MFYAFDNSGSILDMRGVIFDPRVKDICQTVLTHENIWKHSNTFENRVMPILVSPHLLKVVYGVHLLLVPLYVQQQVVNGQLSTIEYGFYDWDIFLNIFLNERENGLTVIFWDVFCLIFVVSLIRILVSTPLVVLPDLNFNTFRFLNLTLFDLDRPQGIWSFIVRGVGGRRESVRSIGGLLNKKTIDGECLREGAFMLFDFLDEGLKDEKLCRGIDAVCEWWNGRKGSEVLQHCMIYNH